MNEHPPPAASVCHSFHDRRRCLYLALDRATAQIVGGGGKHAVSVSVSVFQQARQGGPNDEGISTVAAGRRDGVRCSLDRRAVFFAGMTTGTAITTLGPLAYHGYNFFFIDFASASLCGKAALLS